MSDETKDELLRQHEALQEFATGILSRMDDGDDDAHDEMWERPLSIETETHVIVTLGIGGPHTELDITLDSDHDVQRVEWKGYWGAEKVEREVYYAEPLWDLATRYAEAYVEGLACSE